MLDHFDDDMPVVRCAGPDWHAANFNEAVVTDLVEVDGTHYWESFCPETEDRPQLKALVLR
jgi:hypothetical protein